MDKIHTNKDIVFDENGFAETKMLPYGIYVVHQTKTWENREMIEDFEVNVCNDCKNIIISKKYPVFIM